MQTRQQKYEEAVTRNMRHLNTWVSWAKKEGKTIEQVAHKLGVRTDDAAAMSRIRAAMKGNGSS